MAVTFVIGRAGSGKTVRCFNAITDAMRADPLGPPVYWILPKQATFMAERQLTCASGLDGFCRARVVSFEQLGKEIFAGAGGNVIPEVTPLGRQMILGHLLRRHQPRLKFFHSSARQPGLAAELDATFAEIERAGKTAADLAGVIREMEAARSTDVDGVSLLAKLRDVHLLYDAYVTYLGQERLDPHRRLEQVLNCIANHAPLRQANVYVDGFAEFTSHERRLLAAMGKACAAMEVMLLIDPGSPTVHDPNKHPDEMSLFHRTEQTYRSLWFAFNEAGVAITEPVRLEGESRRFRDAALATIERSLFDGSPPYSGTPGEENVGAQLVFALASPGERKQGRTQGSPLQDPALPATAAVELLVAPDREAEVDAAARGIRTLLMSGCRLRDIVLLVRDLEPYHALIDASFREHDIPYFVDRRRTAAHHPLLQFVRSAFQVARFDWPHDPAIALLKTGLAGVSLYEADEVENYVLLHRIRGGAWQDPRPWNYRRDLTRGDDTDASLPQSQPERVDAMRRAVADGLAPLVSAVSRGDARPVRETVTALFDVFENFNVRQTLAAWAVQAGERSHDTAALEQRGEHEQVWAELIDLFEQMVDLLGEEKVEPGDFVDVLESGLEQFDLALTPPTVDQVLVGQIDRTRTPDVRAAFVLGMNEGEFPRAWRDVTILTDPERRELRRQHVDLDPDAQQRQLDENLLGYIAFTRASERLSVSRPLSDDRGKPSVPSGFWRRLTRLLPDVEPTVVPRERRGDARYVDTPRQLVVSLMRWARDAEHVVATATADPDASQPWPALYQWLTTHECRDDRIDAMRFRAWTALAYANEAWLSPEVAKQMFPAPLQAGVGQLEVFAACPFRHFLRHGIGLFARAAPDVTSLDLSRVYHQVLEVVVGDLFKSQRATSQAAPPISDGMIGQLAREFGAKLRGELMMSSARNRYLLSRIERTLSEVVASQHAMLRKGSLRPARTGIAFGASGAVPVLKVRTPRGADVLLHGRMDRIDLLERGDDDDDDDDEDEAGVAVFDYRMGESRVDVHRVFHGLSLQLLTYLLVLQAHGEELAGRKLTPIAALYVHLLRGLQNVDHPDEAIGPDDPGYHFRLKPRGVVHGEFVNAFDRDLTTGPSEVLRVHKKQDGTFGYRHSTDVFDAVEFDALTKLVGHRLGELADQVLAGRIDIAPYWMNQETPCPRCEYRSVCRFEPAAGGRYHHLNVLKRDDVFDRLLRRGPGDHGKGKGNPDDAR